jgi:hypothetical protein
MYANDTQFNIDVNSPGQYKFMVGGNSKIQIFETSVASKVPHYLSRDPVDSTEAATKAYVDIVSGSGVVDGDKGEISVLGGLWTIDNGVVTNAKQANMVQNTIKGRPGGSTGSPSDLTPSQARLVLASDAGGTTNFFRADGTFAAPPAGGGVTDGDKTDITVSGSGATWTIDAGAVTNAKMANMVTGTFKANDAGVTGPPKDLGSGAATALLDTFITTNKGLVPPPMSLTGKFLKDDGTWATAADPTKVAKTGDSMSGGLDLTGYLNVLGGNDIAATGHVYCSVSPVAANDLTRKDYVDNRRYPFVRTLSATSYSLVQTDEPQLLQFTASTAVTFTIPPNSTVPWPVGATCDFYQDGAGKVTVAPGAGVTIRATPALSLRAQYSAATIIKVATDVWVLTGDLG